MFRLTWTLTFALVLTITIHASAAVWFFFVVFEFSADTPDMGGSRGISWRRGALQPECVGATHATDTREGEVGRISPQGREGRRGEE